MLREFDERDAPRRGPIALSGEFWLGVLSTLIGFTIALSLYMMVTN